jgi:hypothetical protein
MVHEYDRTLPQPLPDHGGRRFGVPKFREEIIRRLNDAYAADNLSLAEFERRIDLAERSETVEELSELVADFPQDSVSAEPRTDPAEPFGEPQYHFAVLGDRRVSADDLAGNDVRLISVIGDHVIDLSDMRSGAVYEIQSYSLIGDTKIIVPPGVKVVKKMLSIVGDVKRKGPGRKGKPAAGRRESGSVTGTVVLRGFSLFGDVIIQDP